MAEIDNTRRHFLQALVASAAVTGLGLSSCNSGGAAGEGAAARSHGPRRHVAAAFRHGVASGDPLADRVILWTRLTPERPGALDGTWEIAEDRDFSAVAAAGAFRTDASRDYTIKVDAEGLRPGTTYFYRFRYGDLYSPAGTTRTLPSGEVESARLAVVSCSNYQAGYFHVYREIASRTDVDVLVHLGDYIYEYGVGGYASEDAERLGRLSQPEWELLSLDDYRRRYAQYRSDADLQAVHAALPMIAVWDDHEIANDAYLSGASNHDLPEEGSWDARRSAAIQAWHEWLPVRETAGEARDRIFRSFDFGNLLSLHMLDTRHAGRDKPLDYGDYLDPATGAFNAAQFQAELTDPNRQLLGAEQTAWLATQLANSRATWQVLGQQVLMGRMNLPTPIVAQQISLADYAALAAQARTAPHTLTPAQAALLAQPSIPYNLDAWDGYFAARETVLSMARRLDKNLVVLAGDTHNAWANDLADLEGNTVGVEFATTSVSSPGLEEYLGDQDTEQLAAGLVQFIEPLRYAEVKRRGYLVVSFTAAEARATWHFVDTVKALQYRVLAEHEHSLIVWPGADNRRLVQPG